MKILFATDGSECSEGAARFLTRFNFSSEDEIIVLHVVSDMPYSDDYHAQIKHAIKRVAPKILRLSANTLKPLNANITTMEEEGLPESAIIRVAADSNADIIVMGARGLKGIRSFLLGSVTRSVAINSPKPVLVTRPVAWPLSGKMKVLFATDDSHSAHVAANILSSLPFPGDTDVFIMNVAWSAASDIPERFAMEIDEKIKEDVAKARAIEIRESKRIIDQAKPYFEKKFSDIREISTGGDPSAEILSQAEVIKADLIAVGSRGLKGIKGMLGSVSRRILGHSGCPVLLGKAGDN